MFHVISNMPRLSLNFRLRKIDPELDERKVDPFKP